jgi:N-acyl-D-amino-acid deacylase
LLAVTGIVAAGVLTGRASLAEPGQHHDLVIQGGRVIDPASETDAILNVGVRRGKISSVTAQSLTGQRIVDAKGLIVTPGFIDVHTHVDGLSYSGRCMAEMGVTTAIGGNCGFSFIPEARGDRYRLGAFLERIDRSGFPVNHAFLAGTQVFRRMAGLDKRDEADSGAISGMTESCQRALEQGAIGVSFGIEYQPGTTSEELAALFKVAADRHRPVTVHPRYTGRGLPLLQPSAVKGYEEIVNAAGEAGASLQISHLNGQIAWESDPHDELALSALELIESARSSGLDITGDFYPYAAWCTPAGAASLDYFLKGDLALWLIKKRYFLEIDMLEVGNGPYKGERLSPELLEKIRKEDPYTFVIGHAMREDLVEMISERPYVMVASDGVFDIESGMPSHPRGRGTFIRVLKQLVNEKQILPLMTALKKMTVQPADRFGLEGKGRLAVGADADIAVFDLEKLDDRATYLHPDVSPSGVDTVLVNGVPVLEKGRYVDSNPGRAIRSS